MRRLFTMFAVIVGALPAVLGAQDSLRLVAGRVRDNRARKLAGVEILDAERRSLGMSDSDGWFAVKLPVAAQTIRFRRVGFTPAAFSLPNGRGLTDTVTVLLTGAPQLLPDLEVEATPWKPIQYAGTTKYDGLFRRQRLGLGSYVSREQLDRRPVMQTLELLQGLPGVRISVGPPGLESGSTIQITRCSGSGSKVTVWVDGARLIGGVGGGSERFAKSKASGVGIRFGNSGETALNVIDMLSRISPGDIEMIEVYRGASQLPAEFHDDGCAVIAVWTRWNAPVETRDTIR